jgi:two-component system LytT family sensor kinase
MNISRFLLHSAFWIWVFAFFSVLPIASGLELGMTLGLNLLYLPIDLLLVYFCLYVLIPNYLPKKKYVHFLLGWSFAILVANAFSLLMDYTITKYLFNFVPKSTIYRIFSSQVILFMISGLAIALKILRYNYEIQLRQTNLELKLKISEIRMLKAQINPHFIFNTLNNIDTLIFQNKDKASTSIMQLSEIMRYTLYKAPQSLVLLEDELAMLKNYLELSRIRYREPGFIEYSFDCGQQNLSISPLILIVYVENAIKHSDNQGNMPTVRISIHTVGSRLVFDSWNRIAPNCLVESEEKGVGLKNASKRLELLYPERYSLKTNMFADEFVVNLILELC